MTDLDDSRYPIGRFQPPAASTPSVRAAQIETLRLLPERLRAAVEGLGFEPGPDQRCKLTISIGIACTMGAAMTPEALLRAADLALYDAKRSGRNRVGMASYPDPVT